MLAFFAGNEGNQLNQYDNSRACSQSAITDMKAYRDFMQYRKIPLVMPHPSKAPWRSNRAISTAVHSSNAADFFGLNAYSWCGQSTFTESGYDKLYANADGYDIPIFLAETGCNEPRPRDFSDQVAVLGRQMNDRFSGAVIYEWHQEANNYGLANYSDSALTGTQVLSESILHSKTNGLH